jgi:urea transporter
MFARALRCQLSSARSKAPWQGLAWRSFTQTPVRWADDKANNEDATPLPTTTQKWTDRVGKGVGQVIFLNDPKAGGILLASLAVGDPILAALAATGTVAATGTAVACKMDTGSLEAGLLAYNGCLVGCAAAGFLVPTMGVVGPTLWTLLLAPASTFVALGLPKVTGSVPQWTWAFNAVVLSQLLYLKPLASTAAAVEAAAPSWGALAASPLVGLSQIFVVNSAWTGLGITAAIATYSPLLATHAVLGSSLGSLTGILLGAPTDAIAFGLWGYNSALTSMAVGVFVQHTRESWLLSAGGAVATAGVFAGLSTVFGGTLGSPCLTLPFCIVATGCHLLAMDNTLPGLALASSPHSPEVNTPES